MRPSQASYPFSVENGPPLSPECRRLAQATRALCFSPGR